MRDLALARYDRVLVHTDPALVPFGLSFPYAAALEPRLVSTGYVVETGPPPVAGEEVVVSAGGGRVGGSLLATALEARPLTSLGARPWRLIAGGASAPERVAELADAPGRRRRRAAARRLSGAAGEEPSLRLTGGLQHGGGGIEAR